MSTRQVVKIPMEVQMSVKNSTDELRRVAEAMQKQFENIDISTPFGKQYSKIINQIQKGFASIDASTLGSELFDESDFKRVASYVEKINNALQNLRVHGTSGTARQLGLDITAIEEAEEKLKKLKKAKEDYAKSNVGELEPAELQEFTAHQKDTGFSEKKTYKSNIHTLASKRGVVRQQLEELENGVNKQEREQANERVKAATQAREEATSYYNEVVRQYELAEANLKDSQAAKDAADKELAQLEQGQSKFKIDIAKKFNSVPGTRAGRHKQDVANDFGSMFEAEAKTYIEQGKFNDQGKALAQMVAQWLNYSDEDIKKLMRRRADNIVKQLKESLQGSVNENMHNITRITGPIEDEYSRAQEAVAFANERLQENQNNLTTAESNKLNADAKVKLATANEEAAKEELQKVSEIYEKTKDLVEVLNEQIKKLNRLSQEFDISTSDKFDNDIKQAAQEVAEASDAAVEEVREALAASAEDSNTLNKDIRGSQRDFTNQQDELKRIADEQERAAKAAKQEAEDFKKNLSSSISHWMSAQQIINIIKDGIRQAYQDIKALDKTMTDIAVVTDMSISDLWGKINDYMTIAQQYGVTTQGVYEVSQLYYQQGLATNEVMAATTETLKLARIAGMDYKDAADAMTVAIRSFKMEMEDAGHVTDVYSKVAAITASDSEELATAMSKTASSAASVGSSFENTTAMLAVMVETTRESAQNLGSALKSIISRYGEMKVGLTVDSEGEEIDYNKVDTALKSVGISIKDAQGQFRDFDDVIFELSEKWSTLDKNTQRYIATILAGNRQQSRFIALVDNWERLEEVSEAAADSADAGLLQYAKTLDSLETKLNRMGNSFQQFYMSLINGPVVGGIVDFIQNILDGFNKLGQWQSLLNIAGLISSIKLIGTLIISAISGPLGEIRKRWKEHFEQIAKDAAAGGRKAGKTQVEGYTNTSNPKLVSKLDKTDKRGLISSAIGLIATGAGSALAADNAPWGAALSHVGSVANGISTGAAFGHLGMIIGGTIGALASLPAALDAFDPASILEEKIQKAEEVLQEAEIERAQKKEDARNLESTIENLRKLQEARYDSEEAMQAYLDASEAAIEKYPELANTIDANGRKMADVLMNTTQSEQLLLEARKAAAQATYKAAVAERNKIAAEISLREQNKKAYNNFKDVDYSMDQFWDPSYLFIQQNQGQDDLISGLGISTEDAFNITRAIYDTNSDLYKNIVIAAEKEGVTVAQKQQELDKYIFGLIGGEKDVVGANSTNAYEALQYHDSLFDSSVDQQYNSSLMAGNQAAIRDKAAEYFVDKRTQTEPAWQDVDWLSNLATSYVENNLNIANNDFDENGLSGAGLNKINESTKLVDAELDQFYLQHAEDLDEIYNLITQASQGKISKDKYIAGLKKFGINENSFIYSPLMDQYYQQDNASRTFYANAILGEGAVPTYEEFLKDGTLTDSASARADYNEFLRQQIKETTDTNGIYLAEFVANASEQQLREYLAITKEYTDAEDIVGPGGEVARKRLAWMQKIYTGEYKKEAPDISDYSILSPEAQAEFFRLLNTDAGTHKWAEDLTAFESQYKVELGEWDKYAFENFSIRTQNIIDNAVSVTDTIKEIGEKHNKGFSWEESQKLLKQIQAIDPSATWTSLFKVTEDGFVVLEDANETMRQLYQKQSDDLDKQQATINNAIAQAETAVMPYGSLSLKDWFGTLTNIDMKNESAGRQSNWASFITDSLGIQDPELEAQILAGIQSGAIYSYETLIVFLKEQQEVLEAAGIYVDSQINNTLTEQKVKEIQQTTIDVIESIFSFIQKAIEGTLSATDLYDMGKAVVSSGTMSADEWHDFASQNISRVGTDYKMNEAAAFALQVNTGNYNFEDLVDQFDSIEEVNEMLKELGENSKEWGNEFVRAAERVLESIKIIKAQDPSDAMFNWMDQDMEGWAGTYEASLSSIGKAGEVINASMKSGTMGLSDFYNMSQIVGQYLAKPGNESLVGAWTQYRNAVYGTATAVDGGTVSVVASTDGMLDALGLMTQATESYYNDLAKQQIAFIDKQIATLEAQKAVEEALSSYNGGYDMDGDGAPDYSPDNYKEIYDNTVITEKERDNLGHVQQGATGYDIDEEAAKLAYYKSINNITDKQWDALTYQDQQNARAEALKVDEDDYQKWFVNQFIPRMDEIMKAASAAGLDLTDPAVVQSLADTALARMGIGGYEDIFSNSEELNTLTDIKTSVANIEKAVVPEASQTSGTNSEEGSAGTGQETTAEVEQPPVTTQKFEGKSYAAVAMGDTGPIFSVPGPEKRGTTNNSEGLNQDQPGDGSQQSQIDLNNANIATRPQFQPVAKPSNDFDSSVLFKSSGTEEYDNGTWMLETGEERVKLFSERQALMDEQAALLKENQRLTADIADLEDRIRSLEEDQDRLRKERDAAQEEAKINADNLSSVEAQLKLTTDQNANYQLDIGALSQAKSDADLQIADLQNTNTNLTNQVADLTSQNVDLEKEISLLTAQNEFLMLYNNKLRRDILDLESKYSSVATEVYAYKNGYGPESGQTPQDFTYDYMRQFAIHHLNDGALDQDWYWNYEDETRTTLNEAGVKEFIRLMSEEFQSMDWHTVLTSWYGGSHLGEGDQNSLTYQLGPSWQYDEDSIQTQGIEMGATAAAAAQETLNDNPAELSVSASTAAATGDVNELINEIQAESPELLIKVGFVNKDGTVLSADQIFKLLGVKTEDGDGPGVATGNVNGLAFATGTEKLIAGANLANKSLVGELGPELAVYNGQYHLLGANGAEFANLPSNAIIFNHKQTEGILKGQANIRGRVKNGGEAFAEGNVSGPAHAPGNIDAAIAALQEARAMWQSLLSTPLDKIIDRNKASGGGSGISAVDIGELEEWYNLLRQIEAIQDDINLLIAERNNLEAESNGEATLRNLRQQQSLLEKQRATQERLMDYQRIQLERQKNEILNDPVWNKFLTFDKSTGAIQYTKGNELFGGKGAWEFLQDLDQMSAKKQIAAVNKLGYTAKNKEGKQLTGEELVKHFVDAAKNIEEEYRNLDNTVRESESELENIDSDINGIEKTIRDNEMALEQDVFNTIVDAWEANIDALEEQKDLIKEANDAYTEGLREALDAERKAYEDEASVADREKLQRELSLLRRSGGSASEIADLEEQINNALKDEYFKSQEDMIADIEEANKNQIELLEKQIKIEEETLEYQKENGIIWQQVATILSGTKESIMAFLSGSAPGFFAQSKNQQIDALNKWSYMIGLYKEDQLIKNTSIQALNDMNNSNGQMWGHTDMSGYYKKFSSSEMTDKERKSAADAYATEYAKLLSEGKTEEQAAEGARKVLRDRIDQYSTPAPKGKNIKPPVTDGDEVKYKTVTITTKVMSGKGSPKTVSKAKPKTTYTLAPNPASGYVFSQMQVGNTSPKTSTSFSVSGRYASVEIKVWYTKTKGVDTGAGEGDASGITTPQHGVKIATQDGTVVYDTGTILHSKTGSTMNSKIESLKKQFAAKYPVSEGYKYYAYKTGGIVDYTGLAMVHGSASKPEAFLNAEQTAQIKDALMLQTKEGLLSSLQDSLLKFQSTIDGTVSGITSEANNSSINIQPGAVVIQVEELANNYDVEKLSNDVMNRMTAIAAKATNRGVNRR